MNCQTRGLTSIRKGLRRDDTPFPVISNSIIVSENLSGRVSGENLERPREAIFTNPEGSQFCNFANPEGSKFANPEGSYFCQSGGVLFLPIRRGPIFVNLEGYCFVKT